MKHELKGVMKFTGRKFGTTDLTDILATDCHYYCKMKKISLQKNKCHIYIKSEYIIMLNKRNKGLQMVPERSFFHIESIVSKHRNKWHSQMNL